MLNKFSLLSMIVAILAFIYAFHATTTVNQLKAQISSLKKEETKQTVTASPDPVILYAPVSPEFAPDHYSIRIVQLGGQGSMIDDVFVDVDGEAYLAPDEWATHLYNHAISSVSVDCRNGYHPTQCELNKKPITDFQKDFGCSVPLINTPLRNDIAVTCMKDGK